ncbi:DNA polymerase III subunit beta family protein, partial [Bacillus cereus]
LFEGDGKVVRMVTTDGHRLSKAEMPSPGIAAFTMLVPQKGILELKRLIEDVRNDKNRPQEERVTVSVASVGGNAFFR